MTVSEVTTNLRFPEGPIAMPDGSVLVVEIERGTLSRVTPDGEIEVIAEPGGGPNGAAIGPDGRCYLCDNGVYYKGYSSAQGPDRYSGVYGRPAKRAC